MNYIITFQLFLYQINFFIQIIFIIEFYTIIMIPTLLNHAHYNFYREVGG